MPAPPSETSSPTTPADEAVDAREPSFDELAEQQGSGSLVSEFAHYLGHTKKWWLLPIILILLLMGTLLLLSGTAVAPFIYALF